MSSKKLQIFIDIKKQELTYESKFIGKFIDILNPINRDIVDATTDPDKQYFYIINEVTVNSGHEIVRDLFKRNGIPDQDFFYVYRKYKKVKIFFWDLKTAENLPENIELLTADKFFSVNRNLVYNEKKNTDTLYLIEYSYEKYNQYYNSFDWAIKTKYKNLLFSQRITKLPEEENVFAKSLIYKIFLDDRLLVERFFPEDLYENKSLAETVHLDLKSPKKIRLLSEDDLYIVKINYGGSVFYPNSKEFILEP